MATTVLNLGAQLDIIVQGGFEFTLDVEIDDGTTDYSANSGFFNIGDPDDVETPLLLGTTVGGQAVPGDGFIQLHLTQEEMVGLPRRPLPYIAWMTEPGGGIVDVCYGRLVIAPFPGAAGSEP